MADKYVDINTLKYMLYDVHNLEEMLDRERFQDHDKEALDLFIDSTKTFADKELFPYIQEVDEKPAHHKDGMVYVHEQVKTMMYKGGELGFISAPFDYEDGGMQIPLMVQTATNYILNAANNHLPGYTGFRSFGSIVTNLPALSSQTDIIGLFLIHSSNTRTRRSRSTGSALSFALS